MMIIKGKGILFPPQSYFFPHSSFLLIVNFPGFKFQRLEEDWRVVLVKLRTNVCGVSSIYFWELTRDPQWDHTQVIP